MPIQSITPLEIKRTIEDMARQNYGYKSVATYLSVLNQIFRFGITEGETASNPTETISVPKGLHRAKREVPEDSQLQIIRNSVDKPFGLFPYVVYRTAKG